MKKNLKKESILICNEMGNWELLFQRFFMLINFHDSVVAQRQYNEFCTEMVRIAEVYEEEPDARNAIWAIKDIIDQQSGFFVEWRDTLSFIQSLQTICQHRDLDILFDWGINLEIEDIYDAASIPELMEIAYQQLLNHGITLWHWYAGEDVYAGWLTRNDDNEEIESIMAKLEVEILPAKQIF